MVDRANVDMNLEQCKNFCDEQKSCSFIFSGDNNKTCILYRSCFPTRNDTDTDPGKTNSKNGSANCPGNTQFTAHNVLKGLL